ncbi:hypothetical protein OH77DRAFT_834366 [Trametes cingulata]|nr:hypothetical protein OH77DRAFT_834366 [Trametes cingulata]
MDSSSLSRVPRTTRVSKLPTFSRAVHGLIRTHAELMICPNIFLPLIHRRPLDSTGRVLPSASARSLHTPVSCTVAAPTRATSRQSCPLRQIGPFDGRGSAHLRADDPHTIREARTFSPQGFECLHALAAHTPHPRCSRDVPAFRIGCRGLA